MPQSNSNLPLAKREINSRRRKSVSSIPAAPLYHPSIFRYTCRGRLDLDSRVPTAGTCKGLQSQLEHVDHWRLTTRDEAIRVFRQKSGEHEAPARSNAIPQQDNNTAAAHSLEVVNLSNVLIYPPSGKDEGKPNPERKEDWRCYGSTEVDLLVLRPENSKQEAIAAVAPYCSPGSTVRDVASPALGRDRTTTIRLGVVEIVYQSSMAEDEEDRDVQSDTNKTMSPQSAQAKQDIVPFTTRMRNSSSNVLKQMGINAQLLYQATKEDFPERTLKSSERIIQEFSKTWERTTTLMKRVVFWDWDDGSDER
eukprot:scaffold783_cov118-Cylindrotheca_fusiformis.AAC.14